MRRRIKSRKMSLPWILPLSTFLQASELLMASAEVIGYRSALISRVLTGQASFSDPEFARMWEEKLIANLEFLRRFGRHSPSILPVTLCFQSPTDIGKHMQLMKHHLKTAKSYMQPYRKASGMNSSRLRKEFFKP